MAARTATRKRTIQIQVLLRSHARTSGSSERHLDGSFDAGLFVADREVHGKGALVFVPWEKREDRHLGIGETADRHALLGDDESDSGSGRLLRAQRVGGRLLPLVLDAQGIEIELLTR